MNTKSLETKAETKTPENKKKKEPKHAPTSKITMGKDEENKTYGKDNNPKREGTKSAERFANYKDGMTVQAAKDAGLKDGDFDNDLKKGFISIA